MAGRRLLLPHLSVLLLAAVAAVLLLGTRRCSASPASARLMSASRLHRRSPSPPSGALDSDDCRGNLPLNLFTQLNYICEDCYELYKQPEVYSLCRTDCFGTSFFKTCMRTLMLSDEVQSEVATYLQGTNNFYNEKKKK